MWFRLSGRFDNFRWMGQDMILEATNPISVTVAIKEDSAKSPTGDARDARVVITHKVAASDALIQEIGNCVGRRNFYSFSVEPVNVQGEIDEIHSKMTASATSVLNTVRWSRGHHGPTEPLIDVMVQYSLDSINWGIIEAPVLHRKFPDEVNAHEREWGITIQRMLDENVSEPIGHDLFRAAWNSRVSNPRASLFLGIAAIEVGTKECIARLVSETAWLMDNLQAPPVFRIIQRYIPLLLEERGNLKLFAPPPEYHKVIHEGVEHRNTLAHKLPHSESYRRIPKALSYLELENLLWTIEDLLWLYDLYCGEPTAVDRVSNKTHWALVARNEGKALPDPVYPA